MSEGEKAIYSERSMVLYKVTFNERNTPDEIIAPQDVRGSSCTALFSEFVENNVEELIRIRTGNKFVKPVSCKIDNGVVLIKVSSGSSGENVDVVDIGSGNTEYQYGTDKAAMIYSRCFISQNYGSGYALLYVEHTRNGAGDTSLFDPFRKFLRDRVPDVIVKFEPLIEPEVIENFVSVESVEVKKYIEPGDAANLLVSEAATVSTKLMHKRAQPFSMGLYYSLVKTRGKAIASMIGLDETAFDEDGLEVLVTLKHRTGATRTFVITDPLGVKIREVLNQNGTPPLDDSTFVSQCKDRCDSAAERIGVSWD